MSDRVPVAHYLIKGMGIELLDVLKTKLTPAEQQACYFFSAEQYLWRWAEKGEPIKDLEKLIVYATWLLESVREHGVQMGKH